MLQSSAFIKDVESVNARAEAYAGNYPAYEEKAKGLESEAMQIRFAITLLKQHRDQKEPFQIVTAMPD